MFEQKDMINEWYDKLYGEQIYCGIESDRPTLYPINPSIVYRCLGCSKGLNSEYNSHILNMERLLSHRGYVVITLGNYNVGRIKGYEVATFMYDPLGSGLLCYADKVYLYGSDRLNLPVVDENEYFDVSHYVTNLFFVENKNSFLELANSYCDTNYNSVYKFVKIGLMLNDHFYSMSEIKDLFKNLFRKDLHIYYVDFGKNKFKEVLQ